MTDIKTRINTELDDPKFDYEYNGMANDTEGRMTKLNCVSNVEKALYLTEKVYIDAQNAGYTCYSVLSNDTYKFGTAFMNMLAGGNTVDFNTIQNDILYAVSVGSEVEDKMGSEFDLVTGTFKLTVNGTELPVKQDRDTYYFGDTENLSAIEASETNYRFKVVYQKDDDSFTWTINENVSNFAPVQLSYKVKLVAPATNAGTYTVPTNTYARLTPVDSVGNVGEPLDFESPTVSYKISNGGGSPTAHYFAIKKVDAQDRHPLNGAKFGLYLDGKQIATATSNRNGIAMFRVDESDYRKISSRSNLYYQELTAPEGYVANSDTVGIKKSDLKTNEYEVKRNAETVRNYRSSTPALLNGDDHFAYVIGYQDGSVRPDGLITRAETATIFFRLLKDNVRDGNLLTSNTYTDVTNSYWANTAISTMTGLGIVQGRSTAVFDPNASITRAEFAAICARFDTGTASGTQTFSDISGHWAEKYIQRAAELGWIKGFEDGTFRPDAYITRAQAMTMINRMLNRIPEDTSDLLPGMNVWPDCNPGDWFYLAVQEATNSHDFKHKAGNYETWTKLKTAPDWTRYEN
ncbi:S-layer homology domain-containing protein [Evtepia sp.]|uniref:S-layer homology domain-containing protein n=1 Tax=Evtepia sp. TaxID=2773933 RepID=UPI002A74B6D2|nr:S-layer homology domain-containing protein [Evtepia sp.]